MRLLSMLISVIMIISQMSVFAEEIVEEKSIYERDINIMTSLGLFEKMEERETDSVVTRGEFAASVVDLLNIRVSDGTRWFLDVEEGHALYDCISAAAQAGIIHGDNGNFYPNRQITYKEAATILVNALGYKDHAYYEGSYFMGYMKIAENVGIKKNVTASEDTAVTVGMAARLLLNAGSANVVIPSIKGTTVELNKGDALFREKHKIAYGKGVFTANQYTSVDGGAPATKNSVRIGGFSGAIYYNYAETEYLGYNVEYYYKEEYDENIIYYIEPIQNKNEIIIVSDSDLVDFDESNSMLYYTVGDKDESEIIPSDAWVIYNGKATVNYFYDDNGVQKSIFDVENGEIKIIDNNGDGKADVVSVFSYTNCVVSAVNLLQESIYDMYDQSNVINFEGWNDAGKTWVVTDKSGKVIDFEDIPEKSVLSVAKSEDGTLLRGILSEDKVQGQVSAVINDNGDYILDMGNRSYELCKSYTDNKDLPLVGANVIVYLDYAGKAAGVSVETSSAGYAFLIKVIPDDWGENYSLKLLTQDGVKDNFPLAESVKIEGERYKGAGLLTEMQTYGDYKIIKYQLNSANEIVMIDSVKKGKNDANDKLREMASMANRYYYDTVQCFADNTIAINSDTVIFETPPEELKTNYEAYKISSISGFGVKFYIAGYTSDPDGFICEALHKQSSGGKTDFTGNGPCLLITDIIETVDEDDEAVKKLIGYSSKDGEVLELIIADDCTYEAKYTPNGVDDLDIGEIIMYTVDAMGKISYFEAMNQSDKEGLLGDYDNGGKYASGPGDANFACSWGYIISRTNQTFGLVKTVAQLSGETNPDVIYKVTNLTNIYHVSKGRKPVITKIPREELGILADYKHSHQTTKVVCIGGNTQVKMLIVYE